MLITVRVGLGLGHETQAMKLSVHLATMQVPAGFGQSSQGLPRLPLPLSITMPHTAHIDRDTSRNIEEGSLGEYAERKARVTQMVTDNGHGMV